MNAGDDHVGDGAVAEFGEGVGEEAFNDELAAFAVGDAAGFEVEEFFVAYGAAGGSVAAFDLVGVDFEAGEAGGLGFVAVEEIAAGLVGVGEVRFFIDGDEAAENGARLAVECVFVKQVTGGMRGLVVLQRALIDDLIADRQ